MRRTSFLRRTCSSNATVLLAASRLVHAFQLPSATLAAYIESNKMAYVLPAGR
jgi:hypothetical protein